MMLHLEDLEILKIFILAGGFGTRLQSVVNDVPKPMASVLAKPFLDYQIGEIKKYFPDSMIYLLTYYKSDVIEKYYEKDNFINIIKEKEPLGTGGSIKNAIKQLNLTNETKLLILNGDTYIKADLKVMIKQGKSNITILSSYQKECDRYGTLEIENNWITNFNEKVSNSKNSYINAGCYYFENLNFFTNINKIIFSIEDEFKNYLNNNRIDAYKYNGIFIDIGIPKDYKKMIDYVSKNG